MPPPASPGRGSEAPCPAHVISEALEALERGGSEAPQGGLGASCPGGRRGGLGPAGLCWDPELWQVAGTGRTGEPMGLGWETPDPGLPKQEGEGGWAEVAGLRERAGRGPGAHLVGLRGGLGPLPTREAAWGASGPQLACRLPAWTQRVA